MQISVITLYGALVLMRVTVLQVSCMSSPRTVFFADSPVSMESVTRALQILSLYLDAAFKRKCRPYHRALVLEMACTMAHDSCGPPSALPHLHAHRNTRNASAMFSAPMHTSVEFSHM